MLRQREDMQARLAKIRAKEKAQRERYLKGDQRQKKRKIGTEHNDIGNDDEEQYVLDDYDSDNEQSTSKTGSNAGGLSAATLELMSKLGMNLQAPQEEDLEAKDETKVSQHGKVSLRQCLTITDLFLFSNTLSTYAIY